MAELVKRTYGGFRGVDFRGEEVSLLRSPDSVNMYKDYREVDSIRTRPRLRVLCYSDGVMGSGTEEINNENYKIHGMHYFNVGGIKKMLLHIGDSLFAFDFEVFKAGMTEGRLIGTGTEDYIDLEAKETHEGYLCKMNEAPSISFVFNNMLYIMDGVNYIRYDGSTASEVVGYVPTTSIGRKPSGGGTVHEDVNLLSDCRINTFVGDGESLEFYLDSENINDIEEIYVDGEVFTESYIVDKTHGIVRLAQAPSKPLTDGQDNVKIKYRKSVKGYADKIKKCTLVQVFDNRVFFSGNSDYPNVIFHSSLSDPTYCSDTDYYTEGVETSEIRSLVSGNNALWVFKEPSMENASVFYHIPTIDNEYGKIYPSTHSSIATGCVGRAINFNDDIAFFSVRGMEGINGDITTEQAVEHRSSLVDRKLLAETNYKNMILKEWNGYLLAIVDNKIYLADSRAKFTNEDHYEYEWFYWDFSKDTAQYLESVEYFYLAENIDEKLYLVAFSKGWRNRYIMLEIDLDHKAPMGEYDKITSHWVTPKDKFKNPNMQKTTNKRGCVVEATGDMSVYVKTNKDSSFERLNEYEGVKDAFCCRIKKKKFKDIQLKFQSDSSFSLESATLECFVGGYLKNL